MDRDTAEEMLATPSKKNYSKPVLVEYGSIAKLTQGGSVSGGDAANLMGACL